MEKYFHFDRCKSLQELDGQDWGEPDVASPLVRKCHELRKIAVGFLGFEDLRMLIGQKIGLVYLVPLALEALEDDVFVAGNFNGDLLDFVLMVDSEFWNTYPIYKKELERILEKNINDLRERLGTFRQRLI
jgi:hypothetical protein